MKITFILEYFCIFYKKTTQVIKYLFQQDQQPQAAPPGQVAPQGQVAPEGQVSI